MSLTENDIELIDRYLRESLDEHDEAIFIEKLKSDEFKDTVARQKQIITALKAEKKAALKSTITDLVQNHEQKRGFPVWLKIAASVLLVFTMSYFLYMNNFSTNYGELYDKYFELYPATSIQRGGEVSLEEALELYNNSNFAQAAVYLEQLTSAEQPIYYVYLGNCYLQLNQPEKALKSFESFQENNTDLLLRQHVEWYQLMSYVQLKDKAMIESITQKIIQENGVYTSQASKLLKEL